MELLAGAIGEASGGQTRLACDGAIEDGVIGETIGPTAESDRRCVVDAEMVGVSSGMQVT